MSQTNLDNIKYDDIKSSFYTVFKSPNPFAIYLNSKTVKDNLSAYITSLSDKISLGFRLEEDSKTFVFQIYKNSCYDKIWINFLEIYLRDSKNFDLLSYIFFVKTLNKDKEILARGLFKIAKGVQECDVKTFLSCNNSRLRYEEIKKIYDDYSIKDIDFSINLREEFVEHFIEKIYLNIPKEKRDLFLDNFILKINKEKIDFTQMTKILLKVLDSYASGRRKQIMEETLKTQYFKGVKDSLDKHIDNYLSVRGCFYSDVSDVLSNLSLVDRSLFWIYIKTRIIDLYYPDIRYLFYSYGSKNFVDKDTYTKLKGNFKLVEAISPEAQTMYSDYNEINDLKEIILEINNNLFSTFLLPIVYYIISEKLSISKKDLYKMKYLLLYIFSLNYSEYKKIYMFFNQLEIFLDYNGKPNVIGKVQIGFSVIMMVVLTLLLAYFYLPIGVFLGILLISLIKYFEIGYPNFFYSKRWNVGLKFFAIMFLCVSSYFWFQNFDKIKEDSGDLVKKVENLGTIATKDVIDEGARYLKAALLEFNK